MIITDQGEIEEILPRQAQSAAVTDNSVGGVETHTPEKATPSNSEQDKMRLGILEEKCARINKVFRDYGINAYPVTVEDVQEAARFTRFSVELKSGESVRSIEKYKADIGRQLEANGEILVDHIKGTKRISVDVPFSGSNKVIRLIDHLHQLDEHPGELTVIAGQMADGALEKLTPSGIMTSSNVLQA